MPMLQVTVKLSPSSTNGRAIASITRRAVASAPAASAWWPSITNSSPPRRATVSTWRRHDLMRSATSISTRSPNWWPRLSLMCLKRSRSRNSSANDVPSRCAIDERELDAIGQQPPVGQPGQRVGVRELLDALVRGEPVGDVAKRVDAPDRLAAAQLRQRHALEHAPRAQLEHVAGLQHGRLLDRGEAFGVGRRVGDAAPHPVAQRVVVAPGQQLGVQAPQHGKALVEGADAARQVGHEDAVGGRFERGAQLGQQRLVLLLGLSRSALRSCSATT